MKKMLLFICLVTVMCSVLAGCSANSTKVPDCFDEETVKKEAKAAIELAESDNYEEFIKLFNEEVGATFTENIYREQYLAVVKQKGTFESFGKEAVIGQTDKDTGANYAGVVVAAKYTDGQIQYTIGFDEDMKLIQFLIK